MLRKRSGTHNQAGMAVQAIAEPINAEESEGAPRKPPDALAR
ncbi:hypothetical protein EDWATA_02121 [Edwardsiella tarda ATCC 23685]|uniref:Uncharacterized protein n=1 Tax=Edwardsiella tarda ATCC 23685 TaxID=500638 RepID=D4F5U3_EDWTA|nr:hypothetical protein EDWATA_02121 [Edwardsiella tarda ATCC 23685]STD45114.1 Uncharacterised protein [Edwardsiella tarda]